MKGLALTKVLFKASFLLFVFFTPLSAVISIKLLIFCTAISIALMVYERHIINFAFRIWDIGLYLLVLIMGLLYSSDISAGFSILETNLSFVAVPIAFSCLSNFTEQEMRDVILSFVLGVFFSCAICLGNAFFEYYETGDADSFFFYNLTGIVNLQPTYLAYYLIFCITIGLYLLFSGETRLRSHITTAIILYFFALLLLTGGYTAFISLVLVFSFFVLKFFIEERTLPRKLTFILVLLMTITMFVVNSARDNKVILDDSWERFVLWESAISANPSLLFGVGTGDYKDEMNKYYQNHAMLQFANESYNSHNQFIQLFFSNGLIGLFAIALLVIRPLYLSYKSQNILGILVLFPFLIYGVTEVFLGRYQGVVFFALLHQIFILQYKSQQAKPVLNRVDLV